MKKIKIFYYCFSGLVLMGSISFEIYIESDSLFGLIGVLTGLFIIIAGWITIDILEKKETTTRIITRLCLGLLSTGFLGYQNILSYKRNACQAKFGLEFNARRRSLSIPEIPASWHIKELRDDRVLWQAADSAIGHQKKYIEIDTGCALEYEYDYYYFQRFHDIKRFMSIKTQFGRDGKVDSVFYVYYTGDSRRNVSSLQADSIFAVEKINKDY